MDLPLFVSKSYDYDCDSDRDHNCDPDCDHDRDHARASDRDCNRERDRDCDRDCVCEHDRDCNCDSIFAPNLDCDCDCDSKRDFDHEREIQDSKHGFTIVYLLKVPAPFKAPVQSLQPISVPWAGGASTASRR